MKRFEIIWIIVLLCCIFSMASCRQDPIVPDEKATKVQLVAPQNVRLAETQDAILWDPVEGAKAYTVIYNNGTEERISSNQYYLELFSDTTTFRIRVKAVGDGVTTLDSDWVSQEFTVNIQAQEAPTVGLTYTLLPDGTYEVSCPMNYWSQRIVIPDTYQGIAVTRIADSAFSLYRYYLGSAEFYMPKNPVIQSVRLPAGLEEIGEYAFWNCISLQEITGSSTVQRIGDQAFYNCEQLASFTFSKTLQKVGQNAFSNTGIREVTLYGSATYARAPFSSCKQLERIDFNGKVERIEEGMFNGCVALKSVVVPDTVTYIGSYAFSGCQLLSEITLSASVTYLDYHAFYHTQWYFDQPDGFVILRNDILYAWKGSMPEQYEITSLPKEINYIAGGAFEHCSNLRSIAIPDGVRLLGTKVFWCCDSLESIRLPNDLSDLYAYSFNGCDKLEYVILPLSVELIGKSVFSTLHSTGNLYYLGNDRERLFSLFEEAEDREKYKDSVYLYSESKPTQPGNYWHYNENGKPVQWEPVEA